MPMDTQYDLVTTKKVAEILNMSPRTLENWRGKGMGPTYRRIGGKILYSMADIQKFIDQEIIETDA